MQQSAATAVNGTTSLGSGSLRGTDRVSVAQGTGAP